MQSLLTLEVLRSEHPGDGPLPHLASRAPSLPPPRRRRVRRGAARRLAGLAARLDGDGARSARALMLIPRRRCAASAGVWRYCRGDARRSPGRRDGFVATMRRTLALAALALAAFAAAAAPAAHAVVVVGIADQKPAMFTDERFADLGIQHARVQVAWDVFSTSSRSRSSIAGSPRRRRPVQPLISFGHSRAERRTLPSPSRFKYEFRRFRERYPWVTTFATWNEANHCGEPTCHRPRLVAAYWKSLVREVRAARSSPPSCWTCRTW